MIRIKINLQGNPLVIAPLWCWWGFVFQWHPATYMGLLKHLSSLTWIQGTFMPAPWRRTWRDSGACRTSWMIAGCLSILLHDYALLWSPLSFHQRRLQSSFIYGGWIWHPWVASRWHLHFWVLKAWHYNSSFHGLTWIIFWARQWDPS